MLTWPQGPYEVRIAFDRPLPQESLKQLLERTRIEFGSAVAAGDRFEVLCPGYEIVHQQLMAARHELPVHAAQVTPDRRTLALTTSAQTERVGYAVSVFGDAATAAALKSGDEGADTHSHEILSRSEEDVGQRFGSRPYDAWDPRRMGGGGWSEAVDRLAATLGYTGPAVS